jgi:hypothetical protein
MAPGSGILLPEAAASTRIWSNHAHAQSPVRLQSMHNEHPRHDDTRIWSLVFDHSMDHVVEMREG